jgi:hypothetical protein
VVKQSSKVEEVSKPEEALTENQLRRFDSTPNPAATKKKYVEKKSSNRDEQPRVEKQTKNG